MKHIYCAGSVAIRCASRLGQPTAELSTTQVLSRTSRLPLERYLGDTPCQGSLPQSKASEYCTAALNYLLIGGVSGPGIILPPGTLWGSAMLSSFSEVDGPE